MSFSRAALLKVYLPVIVAAAFPFFYLFPYLIPISEFHWLVGNDFVQWYYNYKAYLLDYLSQGSIPLWLPSAGGGFPFFSTPMSQVFYPLNVPLALLYRLLGGFSMLDYQYFTVAGISFFAVGVYLWLRTLNLELRPALFSTLIISTSLKMTEILRFPNAVHEIAWCPWILLALTQIVKSKSRRVAIKYGFLLFFSLVCLLTAGYPYLVYYTIFLFPPYLLILWVAPLRKRFLDQDAVAWKRVFLTVGLSGMAAFLLCLPYMYHIATLMKVTANRGGSDYQFSTSYEFSFTDTLGSLVYPPSAQVEGWYYFSMVGLLIVLLYVFTPASSEEKDTPKALRGWLPKGILLLWWALFSYISYGKESYLFNFLWNYVPFFSYLRVWGRLNIILLPILAWILALGYTRFEQYLDAILTHREKVSILRTKPFQVFACSLVVILALQLYLIFNHLQDEYWEYPLSNVLRMLSLLGDPWNREDFLTNVYSAWFVAMAFLATFRLALALRGPKKKVPLRDYKNNLMVGLVLLAALDTVVIGPFTWLFGPYRGTERKLLGVSSPAIHIESFSVPRVDNNFSLSFTSEYYLGRHSNWWFDRYGQFREWAFAEPEASEKLLGIQDSQKLFFSENIDHSDIQGFLDDATQSEAMLQVNSYTGDLLDLSVDTQQAGYVSFIDVWDQFWIAYLDERPVVIELLFNTFKSVYVSVGQHRIQMVYCPRWIPFTDRLCNRRYTSK